jgi:hypothetical protein
MDPITVIVTALSTGATVALTSTAEQAIKDAYAGLKGLLLRKFGKQGDTEKAVEDVERKPDSNGRKETLKEELTTAGAARDAELVGKATELLELLEKKSPGISGGLVGQIRADGGQVFVAQTNYGAVDMRRKS